MTDGDKRKMTINDNQLLKSFFMVADIMQETFYENLVFDDFDFKLMEGRTVSEIRFATNSFNIGGNGQLQKYYTQRNIKN